MHHNSIFIHPWKHEFNSLERGKVKLLLLVWSWVHQIINRDQKNKYFGCTKFVTLRWEKDQCSLWPSQYKQKNWVATSLRHHQAKKNHRMHYDKAHQSTKYPHPQHKSQCQAFPVRTNVSIEEWIKLYKASCVSNNSGIVLRKQVRPWKSPGKKKDTALSKYYSLCASQLIYWTCKIYWHYMYLYQSHGCALANWCLKRNFERRGIHQSRACLRVTVAALHVPPIQFPAYFAVPNW